MWVIPHGLTVKSVTTSTLRCSYFHWAQFINFQLNWKNLYSCFQLREYYIETDLHFAAECQCGIYYSYMRKRLYLKCKTTLKLFWTTLLWKVLVFSFKIFPCESALLYTRVSQLWHNWHWGLENSVLWGLSCACQMFSISPGLHPPDAKSTPALNCNNHKCLQTWPDVPWGGEARLPPAGNRPPPPLPL